MRSLREKLRELLLGGVTPEKLALSLAVGLVLGVFPALGWTTLLCTAAAWVLRLNLPAIQLVNWLTAPLQLALLIPFIRCGEWMFGAPSSSLSVETIVSLIEADVMQAIAVLWWVTMRAIVAWMLVGAAVGALLYAALVAPLRRMAEGAR
jgi:uncharacterized protein (DUF2062 family)